MRLFKGKRAIVWIGVTIAVAVGVALVLWLTGNAEGAFRWATSSGIVGAVGWAIKFGGDIRKETSQLRAEQEHEVQQREAVQARQDANMRRMNTLIDTYEKRISNLSDDLDKAEARADKLEERLRDALALTEQQRATIDKLQTENQAQARELRELRQEIERLKAVDAAQQAIIKSLQQKLDELTVQQTATASAVDALDNDGQQTRNDAQQSRNDAQQARNDKTGSR